MKLNKSLLTAAVSLGFAGYASAQCTYATATHIYVTGSTAFRGATIAAIEACLQPGYSYVAYKEAGNPAPYATGIQTASYVNFYGQLATDSACVIIKCNFSGSEQGYQDTVKCSTQTEPFMLDSDGNFGAASIDSTAGQPDLNDTGEHVDIAMADNSQPFAKVNSRSPVLGTANIAPVGVVPFVWVKNAQTPADITANPDYTHLVNVTDAQLRIAIQNGSKEALFTGNSADTKWVYVAGRDNNSGTRANALLDIGFPTTQVLSSQVEIGGSSGSGTITLSDVGNLGQASGGTLAKSMGETGSAGAADPINGGTGWYAISYLGIADATTALGLGAVQLTLNGVTESVAAIEQGQYSYWGAEQCILAPCDSTTGEAGKLYTCLLSEIPLVTTPGVEIPLSSMACTKSPDSSDPIHK